MFSNLVRIHMIYGKGKNVKKSVALPDITCLLYPASCLQRLLTFVELAQVLLMTFITFSYIKMAHKFKVNLWKSF